MAAPSLKRWMQQNQIWSDHLHTSLRDNGVTEVDQIQEITEEKFQQIARRAKNMRNAETQQQSARTRGDKLIAKFEKLWRQASGVKKTARRGNGGGRGNGGSNRRKKATQETDSLPSAPQLKRFMQSNQVWSVDLYRELIKKGVTDEGMIANLSESDFQDVKRQCRVARANDNQDAGTRARADKLMAKFEKIWRKASGIRKTAIRPGDRAARGNRPATDDGPSSPELRRFMQENEVWQVELYQELMKSGVMSPDDLANMNQEQYDELLRVTRVARAAENQDAGTRARSDKLLVRFEKLWRAASGIQKTNILPGGAADRGDDDHKSDDEMSSAPALKAWMQENECWNVDLYRSLIEIEVSDPAQIADLSEEQYDELRRQNRVARAADNQDAGTRARADKLMAKFEKQWRSLSGIVKTAQ